VTYVRVSGTQPATVSAKILFEVIAGYVRYPGFNPSVPAWPC